MHYDRIILVALAVLLLVSMIIRSRLDRIDPAQTASVVSAPAAGYVRIAGAVKHPGMYEISANMMAIDVIKMAVPVRAVTGAVLEPFTTISIFSGDALVLHIRDDGTMLLTRGIIPVAERLVLGIPLDINAMTSSDLDRVPGIGPELAKRIVGFRQKNGGFMVRDDLINVEGVGEKKFAALKTYFK